MRPNAAEPADKAGLSGSYPGLKASHLNLLPIRRDASTSTSQASAAKNQSFVFSDILE